MGLGNFSKEQEFLSFPSAFLWGTESFCMENEWKIIRQQDAVELWRACGDQRRKNNRVRRSRHFGVSSTTFESIIFSWRSPRPQDKVLQFAITSE